jgi:general secretion pathway protein A
MYTSFFGLTEKPFAITPDPRYLYLSERHAEALAHLLYGVNESGGFIQLTGEVGTGKTTVVRTLLSRLPQHADVAVIVNPRISPAEFLLTICEELGVSIAAADRGSVKQLVDALNRRLLEAHSEGRRVIIIVDEAQNLSAEVLEQVRLLTNLETPTQKLLQIILIGQPELRVLLDRADLRQLAQRITGRYHLSPLSSEETKAYVRHRLRVAGVTSEVFTSGALGEVHRLASGIPRVINVCCDRALLGAYTQESRRVTAALVRRAAGEVYGSRFAPAWTGWLVGGIGVTALGALGWGGETLWSQALHAPVIGNAVLSGAPTKPSPRAVVNPAGSAPNPSAAVTATPGIGAGDGGSRPNTAAPLPAAATAPVDGSSAAASVPPLTAGSTASLNGLLTANSTGTGEIEAYRRLLALWGVTLPDNRDPCGQASKAGLACFDQKGSWEAVRMLNRPAILSLTDASGHRHRVLLTGLTDRIATLQLGDRSEQMPLDAVSPLWLGEFTVVWRPKTRRTRELSVGMSGDEVRWLRRSLNALRGAAVDPEIGDVFDQDLAVEVQDFQREHRLNVDGIAGIQTQMVLETALADPDSPLLQKPAARGG